MSKQDKGNVCACGCGQRKTSNKRRFAPGHTIFNTRAVRKKGSKEFSER